jgi:CHAT domain-containing protein
VDYLPHEGSLLGLEIPVVRLPLSEQPANDVKLAIASAMRPSLIHRDMRACILRPTAADDDWTVDWAAAMAAAAAQELHGLGLKVAVEPEEGTDIQELLSQLSKSPIVMFFGHAQASRALAQFDLGDVVLTTDDIAQVDWTGSLVTLIGCETAALDTDHGDLAGQFINGGARAVIGTTAKITVAIADYFFQVFFRRIMQGLPLDYAFFDSRRDAAVFETLLMRANGSAVGQTRVW